MVYPDMSFQVDIPVFWFEGLMVVFAVIGIMLLYWLVKLIVSLVTGG
jgi:hypothetical protein